MLKSKIKIKTVIVNTNFDFNDDNWVISYNTGMMQQILGHYNN